MDNNIVLETTVKTFENGIDEVRKIKASLVKLSEVVKDLLDFNEIFNLDFDAIKVDEVKSSIEEIITEQKKLSKQYRDSITKLKKSQGNDLEKLIKGMEDFRVEAEALNDKIKNMSQSIDTNKIEDISRQAGELIQNIKNQYTGLGEEYKKIGQLSEGIESLKKTVEEVNEKVKREDLGEKVSSAQAVIEEFELNYHKLNSKYGKLNEDIYKHGTSNIEGLTQSIGKLYNTAEEFHSKLLDLSKDIETEQLGKKYKAANEGIKTIVNGIELSYKEISAEYEKLQRVPINLEKLEETIDTYQNNTIEEVRLNIAASNSIEQRMTALEKKMIFLIDENQSLKKLYSQKSSVDEEFQNQILSVIKENLKNASSKSNNNSEKDNITDKHELALYHLKRHKEKQDLKEAMELFKDSSENGNNESSFNIAEIYLFGRGVEADAKLALQYYLKAANNGHSASALKVIEIYENKANAGDIEYSRLLGDIYLQGKLIRGDIQKAIKWYEITSERGSKEIAVLLIKLYESLAAKKDVNAKLRLGEIYYRGQWGNKDNFIAFKWYVSAEEQGNIEAKNKAGQVAYDIGEGFVYSNVGQAIEWYKTASNKGNAEAQYKLGDIYHKGKVVSKDEEAALIYYQMAADQGHLMALTQIKIIKPFSKFFK